MSPSASAKVAPNSRTLAVEFSHLRLHNPSGIQKVMTHTAEASREGAFTAYRSSLQVGALKLVAKKLQLSLAMEGERLEDGQAAYEDDDDDLMLAPTKRIGSGKEDNAESMEDVFAQARDAKAGADVFLVNAGWKLVEPERVVSEVRSNKTNGNLWVD